jgi:benzylsuccinate CoA-transferase BbsE subunit
MTHVAPGPLAGLRVLELADAAGQFCGKLMADLGADVIKIEPPGGQQTRRVGPFLHDQPHPERSLAFWHYNTSKRGITLNLERREGQELFRRLVPTADIVLETYAPQYLPGLGLGYEALSSLHPGLIMCSLTPFGQTGPWRHYQSSDLLHLAAGGQMAICGYDPQDVPDAPPIAPGGGHAWHIGSHYAYMAILAAVYYRDMSGAGQYIDVSIHEACALTTEAAVPIFVYTGREGIRQTGRHATPDPTPPTQIATADGGWVNLTRAGFNATPQRLRKLAAWMDQHGFAHDLLDDKYLNRAADNTAHLTQLLQQFFTHLGLDEAWRGGQEAGFPWGAVRSIDDLLDDPHLHDRHFFVEVEHPELGQRFVYPGAAALYSDSPWRLSRRAPLIGEHNQEVLCGELGLRCEDLTVLAEAGII